MTIKRINNGENINGKWREQVIDYTGPASYVMGGMPLAPQLVGMKEILGIQQMGGNAASVGYGIYPVTAPDTKSWNIQVTVSAGFTPAGTNSAPTITTATGNPATAPIGVITGALAQTAGATGITGVQAPTFTGTAVAAAAEAQVAAATNLSTVTFRLRVVGY